MNNPEGLRSLYQRELEKKGISDTDTQFVLSLIKETNIDPNMYVMENSSYRKLVEKKVWDVFQEINEKYSIQWNHSNEPLQ